MPRFAPRLVPTLAMLVVVPILLRFGGWQLRRDRERNTLRTQMLAEAQAPTATTLADARPGRHARLSGTFLPPVLYEEGRMAGEAPGYGVFQGFQTDGGVILVDRGAVPAPAPLPDAGTVDGLLVPLSTGSVVSSTGRYPPGSGQGMRAAVPGAIDLLLVSGGGEVPPRDWTSAGYALQWFGMALGLVVAWGWSSSRAVDGARHDRDHRHR